MLFQMHRLEKKLPDPSARKERNSTYPSFLSSSILSNWISLPVLSVSLVCLLFFALIHSHLFYANMRVPQSSRLQKKYLAH